MRPRLIGISAAVCFWTGVAHPQVPPVDVRVTSSSNTHVNIQIDNRGPPIILANPDADWTNAMVEALAERVSLQRPNGQPLAGVLQRAFERIRAENREARNVLAVTLIRDVRVMLDQQRRTLSEEIVNAGDQTRSQISEQIESIGQIQEQHELIEQTLLEQLSTDLKDVSRLVEQGNEVLGRVVTRDDFVVSRESARIGLALSGALGLRWMTTAVGTSAVYLGRVSPAVRVRFWPWVFEIGVPITFTASEVSGGYVAPVGGTVLMTDERRPSGLGVESAAAYSFALGDWNVVAAGVRGGFGCLSYGVPYGGCYWTVGPAGWVELSLLPTHGLWLGLDAQYAFGVPTPVRRYTGVGAESNPVLSDAPELRLGVGYAAIFN